MKKAIIDPLYRRATSSTPAVCLDTAKRAYIITGTSVPDNADIFYKPILNWLDSLNATGRVNSLQFIFNLEFFNIASSKRILFIMYKLAEMQEKGTQILIRWLYDQKDEEMLEIGRDYSSLVEDLHFIFERRSNFNMEKSGTYLKTA